MLFSLFFVTKNRKLLIFLRMREFIGEHIVNKTCISIPNCQTGNKFFKTKDFWRVFSLFVIKFSITLTSNPLPVKQSFHVVRWTLSPFPRLYLMVHYHRIPLGNSLKLYPSSLSLKITSDCRGRFFPAFCLLLEGMTGCHASMMEI